MSAERAEPVRTRIVPSNEATLRIQRILSTAFGIGALLFGTLTWGPIRQQTGSFALWWTVMAMALNFALPASLAVFAHRAGPATLRALASIVAAGYAVSVLTIWPGIGFGHLPPGSGTPWLLEVTAIGTSAAALAWRPWAVWTYTGAIAVMIVGNRVLCEGRGFLELGSEDALYTLLFSAILSSLVLVALGAGRSLDRATYSARVEAAEAATLRARQRERSRMEALMHDSILSTLLTAGHEGEAFRDAAVRQARRALTDLHELTDPASEAADLEAEPFVWLLQGTTTEIAPDAFFEFDSRSLLAPEREEEPVTAGALAMLTRPAPQRIRPIPRAVADALSEALGEALRNSVRHAGKPGGTNRAVHLQLTEHVVRISVLDDGPGFDPDAVPSRRLGIQISISGRLDQLEGGSAIVRSRPGVGTTVVLEWRRP